ncbi:hypothetical protein CPB84DRAFT_1295018 [Gymnopilus junonius]|uniref:Uncharacterized protein n=1 Tax=Gymnopilus junonius TaxID=109634 RepID=A0A9P5NLU7_GYMJU|nr:hypothetical protein CPB84DRAFT_1295018 [Gymnopilus junonius]
MASCPHTSPLFVTSIRGHHCVTATGKIPLRSLVLLVDSLLGDCLLIASPLLFFWRLKLPAPERRLILIVFCASGLTILSVVAYESLSSSSDTMGVDWLLILQGLRHIEVRHNRAFVYLFQYVAKAHTLLGRSFFPCLQPSRCIYVHLSENCQSTTPGKARIGK